MRLTFLALILSVPALPAVKGLNVLAGAASGTTVAVNGDTIIRGARGWITHPAKQAKVTGTAIKAAVKGKPKPPPAPHT